MTKTAIYVGAGIDIQPILLFPEIDIFYYIDSQPFSVHGTRAIYETQVNLLGRIDFTDRLDNTFENVLKMKLTFSSYFLRIYKNEKVQVYYCTNTSFPEDYKYIKHIFDSPNLYAFIMCGYDPHSVMLKHLEKPIIFIGNDRTCYADAEYDWENLQDSSFYWLNHNVNNIQHKITAYYCMDRLRSTVMMNKTWNEFIKKDNELYISDVESETD